MIERKIPAVPVEAAVAAEVATPAATAELAVPAAAVEDETPAATVEAEFPVTPAGAASPAAPVETASTVTAFGEATPVNAVEDGASVESDEDELPPAVFGKATPAAAIENAVPAETDEDAEPPAVFGKATPDSAIANAVPAETDEDAEPPAVFGKATPAKAIESAVPAETDEDTLPPAVFGKATPAVVAGIEAPAETDEVAPATTAFGNAAPTTEAENAAPVITNKLAPAAAPLEAAPVVATVEEATPAAMTEDPAPATAVEAAPAAIPVVEAVPAETVEALAPNPDAGEGSPTADAAPAEDAAQAEGAAPVEGAAPAEQDSPAKAAAPEEEDSSTEDAAPAEEDAPAEEASPAEDAAPAATAEDEDSAAPAGHTDDSPAGCDDETVRSLMDMLIMPDGMIQPQERAFAVDLLQQVIDDASMDSKRALCERLANMADAPERLVSRFLQHAEISIAAPLLQRATCVSDSELMVVVEAGDPKRCQLIASRQQLSGVVASALAKSSDVTVLLELAQNPCVHLAQEAVDHLTEHARSVPDLIEPLVMRPEMTTAHALHLFWSMGAKHRAYTLGRFLTDVHVLPQVLVMSGASGAMISKALQNSDQPQAAEAAPADVHKPNREKVAELLAAMDQGAADDIARLIAEHAGLSRETATRIADDEGGEAHVVVCKALGASRFAFADVCQKQIAAGAPPASVEALQILFDTLSFNQARMALTYWDWHTNRLGPYAAFPGPDMTTAQDSS
ncbi:MAG: DUF2336 domain-containing protein [Hyphomicrobiales bacterium]